MKTVVLLMAYLFSYSCSAPVKYVWLCPGKDAAQQEKELE
jgi:hypothetical protein